MILRLEEDDPALLARLVARPDVLDAEHRAGPRPVWTLRLAPGADPERLAGTLDRFPGVGWAFADRIPDTELHTLPLDDTYAEELWHLENVAQNEGGLPGADIDVLPAWEITDGTGQIIGIFDGGVETTHPDLRLSATAYDAIDGDTDPNPSEGQGNPGHGMLVAGVAAAIGNNGLGVAGVAYGASVLPVRMIGGDASLSSMYDAYINAVDDGAGVLNNSWGFSPQEPCDPISDFPPLNEAFDYARTVGRGGLGTVVVFSAGNAGCEQNDYPLLRDNVGVISVASATDQDRKFGYSVWGNHVDIAAPSGPTGGGSRPGLWSTDMFGDAGFNGAGENNEYSPNMGGTSGAAPVVSGTVALMLAANPRLTEAQVRDVLCATATKIDPTFGDYDATGWSPYFGCGKVDAGAAVTAVANAAPPAPVLEVPDTLTLGESITWTAVEDPDGDALTYDLEILGPGRLDEDDAITEGLRSGLDEAGYPLRALDWREGEFTVRVAARDLFGTGEWSEPVTFTAVYPPDPPPVEEEGNGCGGGSAAWLLLLLPSGLLRRRGQDRD